MEIAGLGFSNVSETFAFYAWQTCSDIVTYGSPASLDDLRTLFLLGLYEFRNSPNRKAWNVTGHLVRQAYHYGLHQVDSPGGCSFLDPEKATMIEQEEVRYLWWSIYTLDTCCNLTIATPSNIDLDMVNTYLPFGTVEQWTNGQVSAPANDRLALRSDIQGLSDLVMKVSRSRRKPGADPLTDINLVIRIVNTCMLRETSNLRQLLNHNSSSRVQLRWQAHSNLLRAVRLALPPAYLNPRRDLPSAESPHSQTLRLVNLIEINFAQFWHNLPIPNSTPGSQSWLIDWCTAIEMTENIVDIVKNWDPSFIYLADPAVGYIIFLSMVLIQTHNRLDRSTAGVTITPERSQDSWQLLKVFLHRLSDHWLLAKALYAAAETFRTAASSPFTLSDAAEIIRNFQKPLTFRKTLNTGNMGNASNGNENVGLGESEEELFWACNLNPNILPDWFSFGDVEGM